LMVGFVASVWWPRDRLRSRVIGSRSSILVFDAFVMANRSPPGSGQGQAFA
jgi:hypothetical protein